MKKIYFNWDTLNEAVADANGEVTFFGFTTHVKRFLSGILRDPINGDVDSYLKDLGLDRKTMIDILIARKIITRKTGIVPEDKGKKTGRDNFTVTYEVPSMNFEKKMERLFNVLFKKDGTVNKDIVKEITKGGKVNECTAAGAIGGGGEGFMEPIADNAEGYQYVKPLTSEPMRRSIYTPKNGSKKPKTEKDEEKIMETTTVDAGDYMYDAPFKFNGGDDAAYDHRNLMADGFNGGKKIGLRRKRK